MNYQERLKLIDDISTRLSNGESEESLVAELSKTLYGKEVKEIMFKASQEIRYATKKSIRQMIVDGQSVEDIRAAHTNVSDTWFGEIQEDIKNDAINEIKAEIQIRARTEDKPHKWTENLSHPCLSQEEVELLGAHFASQKMAVREEIKTSKNAGLGLALLGILISIGSIIYASSNGGGGRIFFGSIVGGLYMAYKGFTAKD